MHPALGRSVWWWWWWRQRKRRGHLFGGAVLRVPSQRDQNGPSSTSRPKAEGGGEGGQAGREGEGGGGPAVRSARCWLRRRRRRCRLTH